MMLDTAEAEHSARAREHIKEQIGASGGWLSFERFMDLALYAPGLGYYSAGARKLGAGGDFTTAPEVSGLGTQKIPSSSSPGGTAIAPASRISVSIRQTRSPFSSRPISVR